ncbi:hypothetical protein PAXRUDRAFT_137204 [Paxillus rubicundulus Ve08.2h10]|uniref:SH3 domain-containing protein n=1 Tax=Paxillus rubicundulus Ve08.2h10 TaxID=930991 RepID=A0A0D0E0M8_9AGAM|nr:hypothetical protein PAXRUDRAFT_137204 [Paxillus rubicundulus Ve08.2h10]
MDLRDQIMGDDRSMASSHMHAHADATNIYASGGTSDEERSVLEDDSEGEDREMDYMDDEDDGSSSLSIPNESIDFDLVYSLHSFAATVEGQASVVKGDSLFLMDDTNSYWWLVRVLKTQDIGYIPAENIETPFERLARLNKHRNVDLAHATTQELQEDVQRVRNNLSSRAGSHHSPSPILGLPAGTVPRPGTRGVMFTPALSVHRYPPAVWNEDEEEDEDVEWDDGAYEEEDADLAEEISIRTRQSQIQDAPEIIIAQQRQQQQEQQMLAQQSLRHQNSRDQSTHDKDRPVSPSSPSKSADPAEATDTRMLAQQSLRHQNSQELALDKGRPISPSSPSKSVDPAKATETRKLTVTPTIARDEPTKQPQASTGPLLPSAIMQKQEDERKRTRGEIEALEEAAKKKSKNRDKTSPTNTSAPVSNQPSKHAQSGSVKLRKEQRDTTDDEGKEKKEKKNRGVFGLFGRKKDKNKDKASIESASSDNVRESQDSGRSSSLQHGPGPEAPMSPVTATAIQQQQQTLRSSLESKSPARAQQQQQTAPLTPSNHAQVSQHASTLRQRDQQQQALYQQYLNRSPSSPPEAPSFGSGSAVLGNSPYTSPSTTAASLGLGLPSSRPRPGSLLFSATADGQGVGVPELSVIRIFAGRNVQTEATFKTVLLNTSTTSSDLVWQAIQRFRLPTSEAEVAASYYLTIKEVEGSSAVLRPEEKPLGVFESLVEAALELPKVKRSSVGSLSSVSSNLSMHPAIKQLSMNDFTDDSAVKFYLNKRGADGRESVLTEEEGEETIYAETSRDTIEGVSISTSASMVSVTPERFSSPSFRFALQLVIFPEDLPDDMVFDPLTEAIVFKNTLRDRTTSTASISSGVSQGQRRKVFTFPKNVTVAEVIELGLERFGILDGVVDGGDEVEDKLTKRRSSTRVRYWLTVSINGQERELSPSSRAVDAYLRPPTFRRVQEGKRRSIDSTLLLGNVEDVSPEDPTFILRRAISYRTSSSRHRMSAPLDEIALQHLRDSISSSSLSSDQATSPSDEVTYKPRQLSRQEIIAAQRVASREKQRAILSAQTNSVRGVDVLLPGNAMIRSSRYDSGDKVRYSYVRDGECIDVSDIIEQELHETSGAPKNDLLEDIFGKNKYKDGMNEKLDRVLSKIKDECLHVQYAIAKSKSDQSDGLDSAGSTSSSSQYSVDDLTTRGEGRTTPTPLAGANYVGTGTRRAASPLSDIGSRTPTPTAGDVRHATRTRSTTPPSKSASSSSHSYRQPSIASVMSDISTYATPTAQLVSPVEQQHPSNSPVPKTPVKRPYIPNDDFGVSQMMAIIEIAGTVIRAQEPPLHPVEEMLFGRSVEVQKLHPDIREIYSGAFHQLDEMDKVRVQIGMSWSFFI